MPRTNWNETFQKLWNNPGQEFLVVEHVSNGIAVKRLRDAGMIVRTEYVTDTLYDVWATYQPTESLLNFQALEESERIKAAREAVAKAEAKLRKAEAKLKALLDKERT